MDLDLSLEIGTLWIWILSLTVNLVTGIYTVSACGRYVYNLKSEVGNVTLNLTASYIIAIIIFSER
jgi:hypothetical protein